MEQRELEELIEKSRAGDRQAQDALVLAVQDQVYYHCLKMLRNPEDAKDATQEILISMLNGLNGLRQPAAFRGWLNRITSNTCFGWLSRGRREVPLWEDETGGVPLDTYEDLDDQIVPDKALDNEETRRMVVELVDALPEVQRLSVLFYYYDEMSVKEIAEAMETSENTVKSRLHYAREAIRKGVDRYTSQGIKLYGFTPVPFIRYFLQKEAADTTAAIVGKLVLTASAGAAAASAAGEAAVTTGLAKILGGILAHKGVAVLAGLVLAGAVTGGVLLRQPKVPAEVQPATLTEVVPYEEPAPAEPEPPVIWEPAQNTPEMTPPVWMGEGPAPEAEEPPFQRPEPELYLEGPEPPEIPLKPEAEDAVPESRPGERDPDRDSERDEDASSPSGPSQDPDPDPSPEPEPDPSPDLPATSVQYEPNPEFGSYLGETEDGVHEFIYSIRLPDSGGQRYPFLPGNFYSRMEVSNPSPVVLSGSSFYGVSPGESSIRYYVSEREEGPYELKAIVYLTVLSEQPILPNSDDYTISGTMADGAYVMERTIYPDGRDQPQPLVGSNLRIVMSSDDPSIVAIRPEGDRYYGVAAGLTYVHVYVWNENARLERKALLRILVRRPPDPVEDTGLCSPREDFSPEAGAAGCIEAAYLGPTIQGLHEFTATVWAGDTFQIDPLLEGSYEKIISTSDWTTVSFVSLADSTFTALKSGSADITFSIRETGSTWYEKYAVVHVTVLDLFSPNPDFDGEYLGMDGQKVLRFQAEIQVGEVGLPCPLQLGDYFARGLSGDENVARVLDGKLYGLSPGSTEIRYYVAAKEEGNYTLRAVVSLTVLPSPNLPDNTIVINQDVETFGVCSGYGYNGSFSALWSGVPLPDTLEYESSDPAVACINSSGAFTTLSAGTAALTAADPGNPSVRYTLTLHVRNQFDWRYVMPEVDLQVDGRVFCFFSSYYALSDYVKTEWTIDDPSVAGLILHAPMGSYLEGKAPGTVTVTVKLYFSVDTASGGQVEMTDTVSRQILVTEAPGPEPAVINQDVKTFGVCSGYGYNGSFSGLWDGETLPATLEYESSDPTVACINSAGDFTTLSAGMVVLTAADPSDPSVRYTLTVYVRDQFDWRYVMPTVDLQVGGRVFCFFSFYYVLSDCVKTEWTIDDPSVATLSHYALMGSYLEGKAPGTVTVTVKLYFSVDTASGGQVEMTDTVSAQILVTEAPEPEVTVINQNVESFGYCSGYGYNGFFPDLWDGEALPATLEYESSDPTVACVNSAGDFTTLSAGTVVLTAANPSDPSVRYTLTLHVRDRLDWEYTIPAVNLQVGEQKFCAFNYNASGNCNGAEWTIDDTSVADLMFYFDEMGCLVGIAPGTATVTLTMDIFVYTAADELMQITTEPVSFQITVSNPE